MIGVESSKKERKKERSWVKYSLRGVDELTQKEKIIYKKERKNEWMK